MATTTTAVTTGDLIPLLNDAGGGVYTQGRNSSRNIREGLISASLESGADGFTARSGVLVRSGAATDLQVTQNGTPGQNMLINKGAAILPRTGQGPYLFYNEVQQLVALTAASSVNSRIDRVCVAGLDKGFFVGDAAHGPSFVVVEGVVSGSPVAPATPTDMLVIADILRATNDNTINTADITDRRKSTAYLGSARILLPGDALGDAGLRVGEVRLNPTTAFVEVWTGSAWVSSNSVSGPLHRLVGDVTLSTATGTFSTSETLLMSTTFVSAGPSEIYTVEFKGNMVSTTGAPNLVMVLRWRTGNVTLTSADAVIDGAGNQPIAQNATTLFTFRGKLTGVPAGIASVGLTAAATNGVATSLSATATAMRYIRVWDEGS